VLINQVSIRKKRKRKWFKNLRWGRRGKRGKNDGKKEKEKEKCKKL
jgi:hypothetical protein